MARYGRCAVGVLPSLTWCILAGVVLLLGSMPSQADEEIREFAVKVKNKPAGHYRMTIVSDRDGTTSMTGEANVDVRQFVIRYTYAYRGTEVWQNGRLIQLDSSANDNGTQCTVNVRPNGNNLRVQANGQVHDTRSDVWTTSYWKLAGPQFRNQNLLLLDSDTGREIQAQLRFVGQAVVNVAGETQNCSHYKITGGRDLNVDVWYDAQERLVRQVSIEQGQQTLLELVKMEKR